ncbi:sugar ABC transporter permease [Actinosynnema sp. NPDC047251]|uniref:Multiple sugar transport system permease protein n=1 Tax=Saccharothrix espanaensis (strain ATCC 51144 / DSM 44229 / JCM 9112 / NBRC 15066 / NRRL 15764) TaxID=1179773 RepID=K0K2B8_SACES|nr:sugar ABC transporter permease [Saccharothrix espanaensis]CCH32476.1 Multiple sugar transport system permease protein [Saccharothrix espanaensis DSM 44229]
MTPSGSRRAPRPGERIAPYLFVAPFFLLFAVFGLYPLLRTAWMSLHRWDLLLGAVRFTGLANYAELLADPHFYNALANTASIFVVSTVPQIVAALGIAVLLNRPQRARTAWHAVVLLPNVVPVVAVALVFTQLLGRDQGFAAWVLSWLGADPLDWQAHAWSAHLGVAIMVIWRWTGYNALIYLAAMRTVPRELYEAAALDGASRLRTFRSVTLPGIRPTLLFTVVVSAIGGLQLFAEPRLFGGGLVDRGVTGGNDRQFQTLVMYLYENGFERFDAGYAATISWVLFLLCAVFAAVNAVLVRRLVGRG